MNILSWIHELKFDYTRTVYIYVILVLATSTEVWSIIFCSVVLATGLTYIQALRSEYGCPLAFTTSNQSTESLVLTFVIIWHRFLWCGIRFILISSSHKITLLTGKHNSIFYYWCCTWTFLVNTFTVNDIINSATHVQWTNIPLVCTFHIIHHVWLIRLMNDKKR
jgi:hypothetical protein